MCSSMFVNLPRGKGMKTLAQQINEKQKASLLKLIFWAGSQKMLAHKLGVTVATVSNWKARGRISATAAIKAEEITNGFVFKEELRPDVIEWER